MSDTTVEPVNFTDQRTPTRELVPGQEVDQVFAVRSASKREKKDGGAYMLFGLGDKSGELEAPAWEDYARLSEIKVGDLVRAQGTFEIHERYGARLMLNERTTPHGSKVVIMRVAKDEEYRIGDLIKGPAKPLDKLERDLRILVNKVNDPWYRPLLEAVFFGGGPVGDAFRQVAAAKRVHENYQHGLWEHTCSVARGVLIMCNLFKVNDRDLALTGALLHDLGKIDIYETGQFSVEYSTIAVLHGEIPLTYYKVRRMLETMCEGMPEEKMFALMHIICSHHGKIEHGASAVPATKEAWVVHMVDNLAAKLGSFDRVAEAMAPGAELSERDYLLGGQAWVVDTKTEKVIQDGEGEEQPGDDT